VDSNDVRVGGRDADQRFDIAGIERQGTFEKTSRLHQIIGR